MPGCPSLQTTQAFPAFPNLPCWKQYWVNGNLSPERNDASKSLVSSVAKLFLTLCDTMHSSTPGFPVLHYLPQFAQTHVHWVGDAILCHPLLLLPSLFLSIRVLKRTLSPLFTLDGQSIGVSAEASVFLRNIHDWIPLGVTGLISCSPRDSQESSPTPSLKASILWGSAFFMVQLSYPYVTTGP